MIDTKKEFNSNQFISTLLCPTNSTLLTEAVNLFPCCDKINESEAIKLYGKMKNGFCEKQNQNCVMCPKSLRL